MRRYGGLYISGGIAAKNSHWFTTGHQGHIFQRAYFDKGRMTPLLLQIPVYIVKVEDTGARAADRAADRARCSRVVEIGSTGVLPPRATPARVQRALHHLLCRSSLRAEGAGMAERTASPRTAARDAARVRAPPGERGAMYKAMMMLHEAPLKEAAMSELEAMQAQLENKQEQAARSILAQHDARTGTREQAAE